VVRIHDGRTRIAGKEEGVSGSACSLSRARAEKGDLSRGGGSGGDRATAKGAETRRTRDFAERKKREKGHRERG